MNGQDMVVSIPFTCDMSGVSYIIRLTIIFSCFLGLRKRNEKL